MGQKHPVHEDTRKNSLITHSMHNRAHAQGKTTFAAWPECLDVVRQAPFMSGQEKTIATPRRSPTLENLYFDTEDLKQLN